MYTQLEQEMDLILDKRDSVKIAGREWDAKWTPAIQSYAASLSSKSARDAIKGLEEMFKGESDMFLILYLTINLSTRSE